MLLDDIKEYRWTLEDESDIDTQAKQKAYLDFTVDFMGVPYKKLVKYMEPHLKKWKAEFPQVQIETLMIELFKFPQRELHYTAIELLKVFHKWLTSTMPLDFIIDLIRNYPYWDTIQESEPFIAYYFEKLDVTRKRIYLDKWLSDGESWIKLIAISIWNSVDESNFDLELVIYSIEQTKNIDNIFFKKLIGTILNRAKSINPSITNKYINDFIDDKDILKSIDKPSKRKPIK